MNPSPRIWIMKPDLGFSVAHRESALPSTSNRLKGVSFDADTLRICASMHPVANLFGNLWRQKVTPCRFRFCRDAQKSNASSGDLQRKRELLLLSAATAVHCKDAPSNRAATVSVFHVTDILACYHGLPSSTRRSRNGANPRLFQGRRLPVTG